MRAGATWMREEERDQILAALRSGMSTNKAAKQFHRGQATISRLAKKHGIEINTIAGAKARAALADYNQEQRVTLLNRFFARAEDMLMRGVLKPQEFQQLTIALAVLIDKRRLEDGEATSRSEVHDNDSARSQLATRLDELAARRARSVDQESDRATG